MKRLIKQASGNMDCSEFTDAYFNGTIKCSFDDEIVKIIKKTTDNFIEDEEDRENYEIDDSMSNEDYFGLIQEYTSNSGPDFSDFGGAHLDALTNDVEKYLSPEVIEEEGDISSAVDTVWSYIMESGELSPTISEALSSELQRLLSSM